jgi:hypothetical protein
MWIQPELGSVLERERELIDSSTRIRGPTTFLNIYKLTFPSISPLPRSIAGVMGEDETVMLYHRRTGPPDAKNLGCQIRKLQTFSLELPR